MRVNWIEDGRVTLTGSVLYVHAAEVGTGAPHALEADFDVVVARGAIDALKRLTAEARSFSCVVAPASLPDLPLDAFVERVHRAAPTVPIVLKGDLPAEPTEVAALVDVAAYVPDGRDAAVAERVRRLKTETTIDRALGDHRRLASVVAAAAVDVAAAEDRDTIESAVYHRLVGADRYRHVWIGRTTDGDELTVSEPVAGSVDEGTLRDLVGDGDPGFIDRSVETGRVVATDGAVRPRAIASSDDAAPTVLQSAAVPFLHDARVLGVAVVSTDCSAAFDGSERELLADLGAIVGHALWALDRATAPGNGLSTSEEIETLVHELRNPLGIAKSHLDIAREDEDFEPLERAGSALDRMADIVDRVGTGIAGEPAVNVSEGDLEEDATLAWESIETGGADLDIVSSADFSADHDLVVRLLSNLFQNAIEHGGESVTVRVGTLSDGFYVADDGSGISPENRDEIFERGYSTAADGLGIGLTIVRDVANAHGWTVAVEEGRGGGARFDVTGVDLSADGG